MSAKNRMWLSGPYFLAFCMLLPLTPARAQLQFSSPIVYPVGTAPGNVVVADFNGDGNPDLAVLNKGSGTVSILLGKGDGTFESQRTFGDGSTPVFIAVADFNGDHKMDLAVANGSSNIVSVLLGNGDGTFQLAGQYKTDISADYVAVGDFNNDEKPDLLISGLGQGIGTLLGNGDGSFQSPKVTTIISFQGTALEVAIGDFNGDGKLDVATGNGTGAAGICCLVNGNVIVLLGNGDGTFVSPITSAVNFLPVYLIKGDFNGDGKADLAVIGDLFQSCGFPHQICPHEVVATLLGNGDATFRVSATTSLPHCSVCPLGTQNPFAPNLVVSDLNSDGKLDLVFALSVPKPSIVNGQPNGVWAFLGNGDGTFQPVEKFNLATPPIGLSVGDFNRDALLDLVVSNRSANDISILLNTTPN
jgi:hypothetical protein